MALSPTSSHPGIPSGGTAGGDLTGTYPNPTFDLTKAHVYSGNQTAPALVASGLTGSVAASRYVGGVAAVAPTTGTFAVGDFVIAQNGGLFVCTVAGTPGTWVAVGGSSSAVVRRFPFAYNTPGLLTGALIGYTPAIGDILLDAWFSVAAPWNPTPPDPALADVGSFVGVHYGFFAGAVAPVSMETADTDGAPPGFANMNNGESPGTTLSLLALTNGVTNGARYAPGRFTSADPLKVCVSKDGQNNGAALDATTGSAVLYLVTATPT